MKLERRIEYQPLPSQRAFHHATERFKGFSGPIGSGKSKALCGEALKLAYLNPGRAGLLGAPTYAMLRDVTVRALVEMLSGSGVPYTLQKAENQITLGDTGSVILLRSLEDYEHLRGTNLAWFGVDELTYTCEEAWLRLEGRLRDPLAARLCGFGVWTPKGYDWVYQRFLAAPRSGYKCVVARPYENRHLLEKIPDFYEQLKGSYDAAFFAQEVLGEYINATGGRVYHAFERQRNVQRLATNPELPLCWALDFNVDPMASVVAQIDGGTVNVLDEIVLQRASTWDACAEFVRRHGKPRAGLQIFADATGARMQTSGTSDHQMVMEFFRREGYGGAWFRFGRSNPPVRERVRMMNAKLWSAAEEAALLVDERCTGLVEDLERVVYKAGTSEIDKDQDPRRTHLSDALGYLLWEEFQPRSPVGEMNRRLL